MISKRSQEIVRAIVMGASQAEVARSLGITRQAVSLIVKDIKDIINSTSTDQRKEVLDIYDVCKLLNINMFHISQESGLAYATVHTYVGALRKENSYVSTSALKNLRESMHSLLFKRVSELEDKLKEL